MSNCRMLSSGIIPMRRRMGTALAICMLLTALPRPGIAQSPEQQIRPLLDEQMAAANAHDTDRFLASYLRGPELVFVFNGAVIQGWDALREQQLKWWKNGTSDVVYRQRGTPVFTVLGPDHAVVISRLASERTMPDGTMSTGEFVVTMIWQKRAEGWRIIHAHESTMR